MTTVDMISHTGSWLEDRTHYNEDDKLGRVMRGVTLMLATISGVALAIVLETQLSSLFS